MEVKQETVQRGARKGFTLLETALVLAVATVILSTAYMVYSKVRATTAINTATERVKTAISVIENVKASNGNAYPAEGSAVDISSTQPFSYYLGSNKNDVAGWEYSCTAGPDTDVTITVPAIAFQDKSDICNAVKLSIQNTSSWNATCDTSGLLTLTLHHVVCK